MVVVPHVRDGIRAFVSSHARTRMHTRLCAHAHAGTISSKLLSKMRCTHTSTRLLTLRRRLSWRRPTNRVMKHLPTTAWSNRPKEHTRLQMQGPRCSRLFQDEDCAHTKLQQGAGFGSWSSIPQSSAHQAKSEKTPMVLLLGLFLCIIQPCDAWALWTRDCSAPGQRTVRFCN